MCNRHGLLAADTRGMRMILAVAGIGLASCAFVADAQAQPSTGLALESAANITPKGNNAMTAAPKGNAAAPSTNLRGFVASPPPADPSRNELTLRAGKN